MRPQKKLNFNLVAAVATSNFEIYATSMGVSEKWPNNGKLPKSVVCPSLRFALLQE
ncbi:ZF protein [Roseibium sp. TrichSKD4]|nr:ZF protein [Roseibium sp. TrichSKD4]